MRERCTLLIEKLKKKLKEEEKASSIETDVNDVEKALEEILKKEADAENTLAMDKKRVDIEMWNRAMESMRTTQKRKQGDEDKDVENAPKPKKQEGLVGTQWHTYVRRMICFRNGKLKNWNCTSSALKLRVESKMSFKRNNRQWCKWWPSSSNNFRCLLPCNNSKHKTFWSFWKNKLSKRS